MGSWGESNSIFPMENEWITFQFLVIIISHLTDERQNLETGLKVGDWYRFTYFIVTDVLSLIELLWICMYISYQYDRLDLNCYTYNNCLQKILNLIRSNTQRMPITLCEQASYEVTIEPSNQCASHEKQIWWIFHTHCWLF